MTVITVENCEQNMNGAGGFRRPLFKALLQHNRAVEVMALEKCHYRF